MLMQNLRIGEGRAKRKGKQSVLWRDVEVANTKDTLRLRPELFKVR